MDNESLKNLSVADDKFTYKIPVIEIYALLSTVYVCALKNSKNSILSLVGVILFIPLIFRIEYLIGPLYFSILFDMYLVAFNGQSFARFLSIFLVVGWLMLFIKTRKLEITRPKESKMILIMGVLGIVLSMHGLFGYTSFPSSYIICLLITFCLANAQHADSRKIFNQLWLYSVVATLFLVYTVVREPAFFSDQRGSIADVNNNTFASSVAVLFCFVFSHFLVLNYKKMITHVVLLGILFILLFISGSRTNMIAAVLSSVFVFVCASEKHQAAQLKSLFVLLCIVVLVLIALPYLQELFPNIFSRFTVQSVLQSGGSGRVDIWLAYLKYYFPDYWLLGIGFDSSNIFYAVGVVNGVSHGAHNIVIDILSRSGIVGLSIYGFFFIRCLKLFFRHLLKNSYMIAILCMTICILLTGIGENVLVGRMLWFSLGVGISMANGLQSDCKEV